MSVTAELCARIAATTNESISAGAIEAGDRLVLDGLAVAVAGSRSEDSIDILSEYLRAQESRPVSSVVGRGFSLAPAAAALINAASMHALDFEPMWKPSNHALSTTLPAALALGEAIGATGRDVVSAVIKGVEIQGWIRQACGRVEAADLVFHQPGMLGPFGAAAAGAHLLGLDAGRLGHALGIAASRCGGVIANIGTMTKATHCGYAASLGLESALLAQRGFTSNTDVFEAKQGYAAAFLPETFDAHRLLNFGAPFRVLEPGYALKAYPCKYQTHYTIVCGLQAHDEIASPGEVQAIRLSTPVFPAADRPMPRGGLEGMFSLQFTFAAALVDGVVGMETFSDERVRDPVIQDLLAKTTLTMDPAISSEFDGRLVQATVVLADGREIHTRCARPPGSWGAPPIPPEQYQRKLSDCFGRMLTPERVNECIGLASRTSQLSAEELGGLMRLCRGNERALAR